MLFRSAFSSYSRIYVCRCRANNERRITVRIDRPAYNSAPRRQDRIGYDLVEQLKTKTNLANNASCYTPINYIFVKDWDINTSTKPLIILFMEDENYSPPLSMWVVGQEKGNFNFWILNRTTKWRVEMNFTELLLKFMACKTLLIV